MFEHLQKRGSRSVKAFAALLALAICEGTSFDKLQLAHLTRDAVTRGGIRTTTESTRLCAFVSVSPPVCRAAPTGAVGVLRNNLSGLCLAAVGCSTPTCASALQAPTQLILGTCDVRQGAILFQENVDGTVRALDSNLCLEHPPCDLSSGACNGVRTQVRDALRSFIGRCSLLGSSGSQADELFTANYHLFPQVFICNGWIGQQWSHQSSILVRSEIFMSWIVAHTRARCVSELTRLFRSASDARSSNVRCRSRTSWTASASTPPAFPRPRAFPAW